MYLGGHFDFDKKVEREKVINEMMIDPSFWDDKDKSRELMTEFKEIKGVISSVLDISNDIDNALMMIDDDVDSDICDLLVMEIEEITNKINKLEVQTYLNGKYDGKTAIMEIHAGAGGTESCDWVSMLYRMYVRYAERCGYNISLLDKQEEDEAGFKSVMFQVEGINAYGYLKGEKGIHRLVRISPFDSNRRRHTSFASVDVVPEVDDDVQVDINDNDIRIDIYRSSGPGGQGVNTTDSAVRITHIPTGIVVTCQNERSQIRNKEKAMEVLRSKLYAILLEEKKKEVSDIRGVLSYNGFGSAKRSYVLEPYKLVKDNDSGYESSDVDGILDGKLEDILEASLKGGK